MANVLRVQQYTVNHKNVQQKKNFYFWDNFGKDRPISIILSPLQSLMNCEGRRHKIFYLSLNMLLHFLVKFIVQIYTSTLAFQFNKKLSYCWETVRRESMPRIAEMDVEMTT